MYDESQNFAETAAEPTEAEQPDQDELPAEADGHDAAEDVPALSADDDGADQL